VKLKLLGVIVVALQVPEVVGPTVTVAVVAVPPRAEAVCWMAMVSPLLTPLTGPAPQPPPLTEMAVQPALHSPWQVASHEAHCTHSSTIADVDPGQ
jgi:hypothetical protein